MNNFITTDLGRMPIVLDDFRFLTESIKEVINGIVSHDVTKPIIVSGCDYDKEMLSDTDTLVMTTGFVTIANEIYKVSAVNTTLGAGEQFYWVIDSSFDPAGLKIFGSGAAYNTYELRTASVVAATSAPSGSTVFAPTTSVFDIYREGVSLSDSSNPMSSFANGFNTNLTSPIKANKGVSNEVVLSGILENNLSSPDMVIGTMKNEFRPLNTVYLSVGVLDTNYDFVQQCMVSIQANGQVKFHSSLSQSLIDAKLIFSCSYLK